MDEELRGYLEAMEGRLMARINGVQETLTERVRSVETSVALLAELGRSTNTLLTVIASASADLAKRVTKLEGGGSP